MEAESKSLVNLVTPDSLFEVIEIIDKINLKVLKYILNLRSVYVINCRIVTSWNYCHVITFQYLESGVGSRHYEV